MYPLLAGLMTLLALAIYCWWIEDPWPEVESNEEPTQERIGTEVTGTELIQRDLIQNAARTTRSLTEQRIAVPNWPRPYD